MRANSLWLVVTVTLMLPVTTGCGRHKARESPTAVHMPEPKLPLPEWAPKNPSEEFLRAAKVLKPMPMEPTSAGEEATPGLAAISARLRSTWPAAYGFFGTLTDGQIERFLSVKKIRIPTKSLTKAQRTALDRWFEAYRQAMKGAGLGGLLPDDYLVQLYKEGAAEDLSNVDVGFATVPVGTSSSAIQSTHRVHLWFWIKRADGSAAEFGTGFAQI